MNVATTIHRLNRYIVASQLITLIIYGLSLVFMRNYLDTSKIDIDFVWKVALIVFFSWTPIYVAKCIKRKIAPSEEDKITHWYILYSLYVSNIIMQIIKEFKSNHHQILIDLMILFGQFPFLMINHHSQCFSFLTLLSCFSITFSS